MSVKEAISLMSGVALFLFGMTLMGEGLKKVSGNRLAPILFRLSSTPLRGILLGTGVTAVIQSSCATAVMTVGFVNSGMMKLRQAIYVILGAILGTSITGWVICLSYIEGAGGLASLISTSTLTGLVAVVGIILRMFAKKNLSHHLGDILMGFAVLMFGMSTMSGAVSGLGKTPWFHEALISLSHPLAGILLGTLFTALLQSASAAVGIIQALSVTGAMELETVLPLLMGVAIGASAPVLFSAIGANVGGRRAALTYPIATGFGVLVVGAIFYALNAALRFGFMEEVVDPFSVAFINTLLRLAMTLMLVPLGGLIEKTTQLLAPDDPKAADDPSIRLEERFLVHPALALEQSRQVINDMAQVCEGAINDALTLFTQYSEAGFQKVKEKEDLGDRYEDSLGTYLVKLSGREMNDRQNEQMSEYLHTLSDFERISDHALNLAGNAQEVKEKDLHFSDNAAHELEVLFGAISQILTMTVSAFVENDLVLAARVEPLEELIDDLCDKMKLNHIERLQQGVCTITQGFVFNDIVTNCERVSDHCSNIAVCMIELSDDAYRTHSYTHDLREKQSDAFKDAYEQYQQRFAI